MANSFLDRNKKKSSSGLLLFLGAKRGPAALLLVLAVVMGLFIAPANFTAGLVDSLDQHAWGKPFARALSYATGTPRASQGGYADIVAQLRAARQQTNKTAWSLFTRGSGGSNADSVGMILGGEHDVLGAASIAGKIQGGKTINGVLSPADSRRNGAKGVELRAEDLGGSFVASAAAGVFSGANLLTGGKVAPATPETEAGAAMKTTRVPQGDDKMIAGREGKLSKTEFGAVQANTMAFKAHRSNVGLPGSALYVLAEARTRAQMSRTPICSKENGCSPEYAQVNTSAVYDGNLTGRRQDTGVPSPVTGFDGSNTINLLKDGGGDSDADMLEKIKSDQRACDEADATYKPLMNPHVQRMNELARLPMTPANRLQSQKECRILDDLMRQQYNACPLRHEDGPYEPYQCD